jgi:hypothetical protein
MADGDHPMRLKLALLTAATALVLLPAAMPASAQAYRDCRNVQANNQAAGVVLGGLIGGVLGSNVAARGHRGDGTAVGAVVGALAGSEIGRGNTNCGAAYSGYNSPPYPPPPPSAAYGYPDGELAGGPGYGYRDDARYADGYSGYTDRYDLSRSRELAARDRRQYTGSGDYDERECSSVNQVTRLPDGSRISRPVLACRDTYHGEWEIED